MHVACMDMLFQTQKNILNMDLLFLQDSSVSKPLTFDSDESKSVALTDIMFHNTSTVP